MIFRSVTAPAILSALLLGLAAPASAVDAAVVLSGPAPVRIWKSPAAMEKGKDLLGASASPDAAALSPLLACEVAPGTRATVARSAPSYAWEAEVIEGPLRGCQGVVGPRDFKTEAELAPRPRVEASAPPEQPGPAGPSQRMMLWYQLYVLAQDGRTKTAWEPVAGWENPSDCDNARRRLTQADEREVSDIFRRFEAITRASRGQLTMTRIPSADGIDIELGHVTREGNSRTVRVQVRSYCFPADYNPRR
jgi:hypothetical protein